MWLHLDLIQQVAGMCREVRPYFGKQFVAPTLIPSRRSQVFVGGTVSYAYTCIPTYPSGQIGFMLCSKAGDAADFAKPHRAPPTSGAPTW